ncbi:hypothetical protein JCM5353_005991 [Sporobolomyces roseus]
MSSPSRDEYEDMVNFAYRGGGGIKRRRTSESPPRVASSSTRGAEGTNGLVGSSRDLERDEIKDEEEQGSQPSTEEEDYSEEGEQIPMGRTVQEGTFGMAFPGDEDEDEDDGEEPDTEPSDEEGEEESIIQPQAGPSTNATNPLPPLPPRVSPAVLDLTDDGSDDDEPLVFESRPSPLHSIKPSASDDDLLILSSSSAKPFKPSTKKLDAKGKGRAIPSPSPSTAPPPSAETLPSLATLSCPICLGPPTPLALTQCGHAFCAPCLHAALVAGPALTPPPPGTSTPPTRGRGRQRGRGNTTTRGRWGVGVLGGGSGVGPPRSIASRGVNSRTGGGGGVSSDVEDEGDPELNKHCPVCRTPLYGGWGKSLRGLVLRMAPVKRR